LKQLIDKLGKEKLIEGALSIIALLLLTLIVYAPLIDQLGYYNEDWYHLMVIAKEGPDRLISLYSIDRPFMGWLNYYDYLLIGDNLLAWNVYALLCRFLIGVGVYWVMKLVWPKRSFAGFAVALLVLVYPGFLSQPHAMNYKNYLFEYALALFSIALTIKWVKEKRITFRILYALLSILSMGGYILIYEFMIGLEGTRVLLLLYVFWQETEGAWKKTILQTIKYSAAYAAVAGAFVYWRFFIFSAARSAVREGDVIGQLISSPFRALLRVILETGKDFIESVLFAWAVPSYERIGRAYYIELGYALIFVVLAVVLLLAYFWLTKQLKPRISSSDTFSKTFILLGSLSTLFSILSIVIPGRNIQFNGFERYSLHATFGIALLIVGLLLALPRKYSVVILVFLVALSTATHYLNANRWKKIWDGQKTVWWQASWRIPQIEGGTVVVIDYPPYASVEQDYEVFGPMNLVYDDADSRLLAEVLNPTTVHLIETGVAVEDSLRGIYMRKDFSSVLVMSMPGLHSCLHVHDGNNLEFGADEDVRIKLIAPYSRITLIDPDGKFHAPPESIFGPEPEHNWCYYYEKAALARQLGDWEEVARLLDEAESHGYRANDSVEWMPFLEAYVHLGMYEEAREIGATIRKDKVVAAQLCNHLTEDPGYPGVYDYETINATLCH
jgi:hypothetical protein